MSAPVVISGLGVVAGTGVGRELAWDAMRAGRSAIAGFEGDRLRRFGPGAGAHIPVEAAPGEEPRIVGFLETAVAEALDGLPHELRAGTGLALGTSQGALDELGPLHRRPEGAVLDDAACSRWRRSRPGYGMSRVAKRFGLDGPRSALGMVCVSSSVAVLQAARWVRSGRCERALAGGYEELSPFIQAGFGAIGALANGALNPFDRRRSGTLLGEAACVLLLERADLARSRGARIWGGVLGGAVRADAAHMTAPDMAGRGLERTLRAAMRDAGCEPDTIDAINAHGTGTIYNDLMECRALERVFGAAVRERPVYSLKSIFGHTLGAAGALDLAGSLLAAEAGCVPGTVGHEEPLEGLDWDFVPGPARVASARRILSTNSAFGGTNTALLLSLGEAA
jgi:3-oxoacyl-[acyl-carrier-protein] synthase II